MPSMPLMVIGVKIISMDQLSARGWRGAQWHRSAE
jgi:hypothetical protein